MYSILMNSSKACNKSHLSLHLSMLPKLALEVTDLVNSKWWFSFFGDSNRPTLSICYPGWIENIKLLGAMTYLQDKCSWDSQGKVFWTFGLANFLPPLVTLFQRSFGKDKDGTEKEQVWMKNEQERTGKLFSWIPPKKFVSVQKTHGAWSWPWCSLTRLARHSWWAISHHRFS
jgi:hypothetical protein